MYSAKHNSVSFTFGSISYKNDNFQVLILTIYLIPPIHELIAANYLLSHKNKLIVQIY